MSTFTTPLVVEYIGPNKRRTFKDFSYSVGSLENPEYVINVPSGFITDYATIPRILWPIFSPDDIWAKAAVIHDFLYSYSGFGVRYKYKIDRKKADDIFLEAMGVLKVPAWRKYAAYTAVRIFGGLFWAE